MRHSFLSILAALCLSACASAPTPPPAAAAPAPAAADQAAPADAAAAPQQVASAEDAKKLVCYDEPGTGTHVRRTHRICATAEEWARIREQNQKALQNMSTRRAQSAVQGH